MDKVLITGATGFIGKHFVKRYNNSFSFFPIVRKKSDISYMKGLVPSENIIFFEEDSICDSVKGKYIETLIHLASNSKFNHTFKDIRSLIESNITFPCQVLESFVLSGGKRILNIGTFWQYCNDNKYSPNSLYAATKKSFEDLIEFYLIRNKICCLTLNLFDTYGPDDKRGKIFETISKSSISKSSLDLTSGTQIINLTHIYDVCFALKIALETLKNTSISHQRYFVKNKDTRCLKDVIDLFVSIKKLKVKLNWGKKKYSSKDFFSLPTNLKNIPNWSPSISLEDGFKSLD